MCQHQRGVFVKGEGLAVDSGRIVDIGYRKGKVLCGGEAAAVGGRYAQIECAHIAIARHAAEAACERVETQPGRQRRIEVGATAIRRKQTGRICQAVPRIGIGEHGGRDREAKRRVLDCTLCRNRCRCLRGVVDRVDGKCHTGLRKASLTIGDGVVKARRTVVIGIGAEHHPPLAIDGDTAVRSIAH